MYLVPSCQFRRHVLTLGRSLLFWCPCRHHVLVTMPLLPEMILPYLCPQIRCCCRWPGPKQPPMETTTCDLSHRRPTAGTSWGRRSQLPRKHGHSVIARPLQKPPPQASEDEDDHMRKSGVVWSSDHAGRWATRKRSHRSQRYLKRLIVQKICVRSKRRDSPDPTFPPGLWMELYLVIGEVGIYTTCCLAFGQWAVAPGFHS